MNRIGIDLGGTKIEGILLDHEAKVVARKRIPTESQKGYSSIISRIAGLIDDLRKKAPEECMVGVCTPGTISPHSGRIRNSNTLCLINQPMKEDLESCLRLKIAMDNDANCFAVAEATLGAGKNYNMVFGVIMGTGVGGGIVINKRVHQGRMNIAGEWGHHKIRLNGKPCYCGHSGCVETYISGPALEQRWQELTGQKAHLKEISASLTNNPSETARQWKKEFLQYFGLALSNVIDILDPDAIVIGGGVSNIPFLYDEGVKSVYKYVFSDTVDTPVIKNKLGDSAGVFGAALLNPEL